MIAVKRTAGRAMSLLAIVALGSTGCATAAASPAAAAHSDRALLAVKPADIEWVPMKLFGDGRARANVIGDPEKGGAWMYRTRVPNPIRVPPHTHPVDEHVTVLEGTWYLGVGRTYAEAGLVAYPAGSYVRIPAGLPHFVATKDGTVMLQSVGEGVFRSDPIE